MSERSSLMSSTVPFSDAKVPPLTPPLTRRTTSVVSVSSPAASCRTRTPMSDGIESKPQLWTMRATRPRGRIKPLDRLAHEKRLAGEVGVVGAGRGARLDERHPVTPVRPDGRGDRSRPRRELGERNAVLGVRDDQGPIRRPRAKLATHAFELL